MEQASSFGALLRRYRAAAGLTQEELAGSAGLSARGLRHLEREERRPYPDTIRRLTAALALTPAEHAAFAAAARAAQRASRHPRHNLPVQMTRFIGREHALAQLRWLLAERPDRQRLLTLTGAGGCGKTRLALEVAAGLLGHYAHGVWLVEMAPLADPALAPLAVATALGLREEAGQPLSATLSAALRLRQVLLVLDNCEHMVEACAMLAATLLQAGPDVQILATSREALGLAGEMVWRTPSLLAPDPWQLPSPEALTDYEAVRLFVDRAQAVQPLFALTEQNALAVAQICQRLDGIPLAIELAAALARGLAVSQIARRLDERFRLLTGGSRTALPRQQTLRATVDWSYALLSAPEQTLFNRLAVFAGGFTLDAVETVCTGGQVAVEDMPGLLVRLVDTSLVVTEDRTGDVERYRLLETLRQYGRERLQAERASSDLDGRHATYYRALAEEAHLALQSMRQVAWFERLNAERQNIRQALRWALDVGAVLEGLRLAGALMWYWYFGGYASEGQQWLAALLARPEAAAHTVERARALTCLAFLRNSTQWLMGSRAADTQTHALVSEAIAIARQTGAQEVRAFALWVLGTSSRQAVLLEESLALYRHELRISRGVHGACHELAGIAWERGDKVAAHTWWSECLRLARQTGDSWDLANDLLDLGLAAYHEGDYVSARRQVEESLALRRAMLDHPGLSSALSGLGAVARAQGDTTVARTCYEEKLALWQQVGDRTGIAAALTDLAALARQEGAYAQAQALCQEALTLRQALDDRAGVALSLGRLGDLAYAQGDHQQAATRYREGLALLYNTGGRAAAAVCLAGMARVSAAYGRLDNAARLHGAAAALHPATLRPSGWDERAGHDRQIAAVRVALGEEAFAELWGEGRGMALEEAIAAALKADLRN